MTGVEPNQAYAGEPHRMERSLMGQAVAYRFFDLQELAGKAAVISVHAEQGTTLAEMVIENLLLERFSEKR